MFSDLFGILFVEQASGLFRVDVGLVGLTFVSMILRAVCRWKTNNAVTRKTNKKQFNRKIEQQASTKKKQRKTRKNWKTQKQETKKNKNKKNRETKKQRSWKTYKTLKQATTKKQTNKETENQANAKIKNNRQTETNKKKHRNTRKPGTRNQKKHPQKNNNPTFRNNIWLLFPWYYFLPVSLLTLFTNDLLDPMSPDKCVDPPGNANRKIVWRLIFQNFGGVDYLLSLLHFSSPHALHLVRRYDLSGADAGFEFDSQKWICEIAFSRLTCRSKFVKVKSFGLSIYSLFYSIFFMQITFLNRKRFQS